MYTRLRIIRVLLVLCVEWYKLDLGFKSDVMVVLYQLFCILSFRCVFFVHCQRNLLNAQI